MTTPDERAQALIDSIRREFPECWMSGRQRAVLVQAITNEIKQAKAEVWAEVKQAETDLKAENAQLRAALLTALHELRAIQARDGAPQHIDWDRGSPIQTDSCTHDWWNTVVQRCEDALILAQKGQP